MCVCVDVWWVWWVVGGRVVGVGVCEFHALKQFAVIGLEHILLAGESVHLSAGNFYRLGQ